MAFLNEAGVSRLWQHILAKLNLKADKTDVEAVANLVGEEAVSTQISNAIAENEEIYVGPEEPTNPNVDVWIDTDANADTPEEWRTNLDVYSKAETDAAIKNIQVGGHNLLDNSYFKQAVNQRGFTTKETDASGTTYIADRWLWWNVATANYNISISNTGFTVTAKSGTTRLVQRIEPNKINATKTYTAYCMCTDGTMILGSVNNTTFGWGNGGYSCLFDVPAGKTVIWAAAYEGAYTAETFPAYEPKGYAVELAECMRYYQKIKVLVGDGASAAKRIYVMYPQPMRIIPTITETHTGTGTPILTALGNTALDVKCSTGYADITVEINAEL